MRLGAIAANLRRSVPSGPQELIANGTFDTDTSGWGAVTGSLSAVAGWCRLTASGSPAYAYQAVSTEVGTNYRVMGEWRSSAGTWRLMIGTSQGGGQIFTAVSAASGTIDTTIVATTNSTFVTIRSASAPAAGDYAEIDNVSVMRA